MTLEKKNMQTVDIHQIGTMKFPMQTLSDSGDTTRKVVLEYYQTVGKQLQLLQRLISPQNAADEPVFNE